MNDPPRGADGGKRSALVAAVAFVFCAGLLAWHAAYFVPFFSDDSFISLRYAARLLDGFGLTWTDGERVEGYSNLLWVLLVALAGLPGQDLVLTARVVGTACGIAILGAFFWTQRLREPRVGIPSAVIGALAVSLSGPVAAHCIGGLEQPLLSALVVWGLACTLPLLEVESPTLREIAVPGVLFGLASLSRPDAPLIVAAACAALVVARGVNRESLRTGVLLAGFAATFYLAQLAFRLGYYGEWIPNTARGKTSFTPTRLKTGWRYVSEAGLPLSGLFVALGFGMAAAVRDLVLRRQLILTLTPAFVWCAFVLGIGGDHVPQHRHMVVAIAMGGLAVSLTAAWFLERFPRRRTWTLAISGLLLVSLAAGAWLNPHRRRAKRNLWYWSGEPVGLFLRGAFEKEQPLVAVDAAGALPYYSELPSIDMLGLTDKHIAHHPPESLGRGKLAHELGDGAYVLSRQPDLVIFNTPVGAAKPNWRSGRQMKRSRDFRRDYRLVTFRTDGDRPMSSQMWTRLEGAVGVRRTDDSIEVPGYLLSHGKKSHAKHDEQGNLYLQVTAKRPGRLRSFEIGPGSWTIHVDSEGGVPAWKVMGEGRVLASEDGPQMTLQSATSVTITMRTRDGGPPVELRRVVFSRDR